VKVADYIVQFLVEHGVTDVFGMPGGVVLDLLYSLDARNDLITVHINAHEQASAFAACGYAQASGKLGVAYSTRGPGVTNMVTGIVDAFHDSLPVLFITAHTHIAMLKNIRFEENQEFDTVQLVSGITKYAIKVEKVADIRYVLEYAYSQATKGRPGPVFLDFLTDILRADIDPDELQSYLTEEPDGKDAPDYKNLIVDIKQALKNSKQPVLLIGDGIHQTSTEVFLRKLIQNLKIPVISSRFVQDLVPDSEYYYGYIGSHATRYSNFILSKCDLLVSLGNRLSYNSASKSFEQFSNQSKIIRIDVDTNEFNRNLPNTVNFYADLKEIMPLLAQESWEIPNHQKWISVCNTLRDTLKNYDIEYPVGLISAILKKLDNDSVLTSDVGNNEMWVSRAYTFSGAVNRILYSKSFGVLGCSLPKAIGAYCATKKPVICFSGDQGFQMNMQELQFMACEKMRISIIILNNNSSGMIRSEQKNKFAHFVHTTQTSGYSAPNFRAIANAFGIHYSIIEGKQLSDFNNIHFSIGPQIIEMIIDEDIGVFPKLPNGRPCQDFDPQLDRKLYKRLNGL
jgi:acetolactate synthase-1/2/3 large subunit